MTTQSEIPSRKRKYKRGKRYSDTCSSERSAKYVAISYNSGLKLWPGCNLITDVVQIVSADACERSVEIILFPLDFVLEMNWLMKTCIKMLTKMVIEHFGSWAYAFILYSLSVLRLFNKGVHYVLGIDISTRSSLTWEWTLLFIFICENINFLCFFLKSLH